MATKPKSIIAMSAPVSIEAGAKDGEKQGPAKFTSTFYTGGALTVEGWDEPVIVDLAGLKTRKVLVANLDHDSRQRVGNFSVTNDGKTLVATGAATASTAARDEVVQSAADGYEWQSSLEVLPEKVDSIKAGKSVVVNGQTHEGPVYVTRVGTLKGFAFVSHGADDNTTASIAASAASSKEKKIMKAEVKAWAESMGADLDNATPEMIATIEANYAGLNPAPTKKKQKLDEGIDAKQNEFERQEAITEIALNACDKRPYDIKAIKELAEQAVEGKWAVDKFRLELLEASLPPAHTVFRTRKDDRLNEKVLEAAVCQAGRIEGIDKMFDEQTLQVAHDRFKGRIGLKQLFLVAAQANGYHDHNLEVNEDVLRAAFSKQGSNRREIQAQGWSALDIANTLAATANKFIFRGWNMIDQTCLRIGKVQSVRDFKTATTISLTDSLIFEKVGTTGQIKNGTLADLTYTVKAETYAKMLAITRQDIINDDLSALTDVPMKLGLGAMKILNDIFWSKFLGLVNASFFVSGNNNINTGVADMTVGGLDATETIFMNQTNPDGTPLGLTPSIIVVPTALYNKALTLMGSQGAAYVAAYATASGDKNPFFGRYRVETSPYISNSSYTGYTSVGWWMLGDPNQLPVITIAALNGNVMPTVDTAQAAFNVLGIEMRGYSDVGVNSTEYRGGVYADGGSS